jgi:hypothetical protein
MDDLRNPEEQTQKPPGLWSLPEAGTADAHPRDGDARQVAEAGLAHFVQGGPWPGRAEQPGHRTELVAEAAQGRGDA